MALLDFLNVIGLNEQNSDSESFHACCDSKKFLQPLFSLRGKVFWPSVHHVTIPEVVIPRFVHYVKLACMVHFLGFTSTFVPDLKLPPE